MNKLIAELQRLYFLDDQRCAQDTGGEGVLSADVVARSLGGGPGVELDLVGADGRVRALIVEFNDAADWPHAADLYQAVQDELDLPAPALGVAGFWLAAVISLVAAAGLLLPLLYKVMRLTESRS